MTDDEHARELARNRQRRYRSRIRDGIEDREAADQRRRYGLGDNASSVTEGVTDGVTIVTDTVTFGHVLRDELSRFVTEIQQGDRDPLQGPIPPPGNNGRNVTVRNVTPDSNGNGVTVEVDRRDEYAAAVADAVRLVVDARADRLEQAVGVLDRRTAALVGLFADRLEQIVERLDRVEQALGTGPDLEQTAEGA